MSVELSKGQLLDRRYEILRVLGSGGMGEVYLARRAPLGDAVAIKRLLPERDTPENHARFLTEARAAAHIRHPNVVNVFDFGDPPGQPPYIVMEYLEGPTLAEELQEHGRLSVQRALPMFASICAAVEAGHRRGIIHRDIKPANVILSVTDDGHELVKVLDFGVAQMATGDEPKRTNPGEILGTVQYMAPEQAMGEPVGPTTDVFTLGIVLYEMLTGVLPFEAKTRLATLMRLTEGEFRSPRELVAKLPNAVVDAIHAALQVDPSARPPGPEILARMAGADRATRAVPRPAARSKSGAHSVASKNDRAAAAPSPKELTRARPVYEAFVGRTRELEGMRDELNAARQGRGRIVVVHGEAGVGKSSLIAELLKTATTEGAVTLHGSFYDYEASRPPPYETFLGMLGNTSDGLDEALDPTRHDDDADRWQAFAAVTDAVAAKAVGRPLIVALEDLQWANQLDLDLITHLHRVLGAAGAAFVVSARTGDLRKGELAAWCERGSRGHSTIMLPVAPLDEADVRQWFDAAFGTIRLRPHELSRLASVTGGLPYYLVELTRHLVGAKSIEWSEAGWQVLDLDSAQLPQSVSGLLEGRISDLSEDVRAILELASVVGDEFRFDTVMAASGQAEEELEKTLESAVHELLITEVGVSAGNDYRFRSSPMRQVIYAGIPRRRRQRAHAAVVAALEAVHAGHLERITPMLTYHYTALEDWQRAFRSGLVAAERSLAQHDNDRARAAVDRARIAADRMRATGEGPNADELVRLDLLGGEVLSRIGRSDKARDVLTDAWQRVKSVPASSLRGNLRLALARAEMSLGNLEAAAKHARAAAGIADARGERVEGLRARVTLASYLTRTGGSEEAADLLDTVLTDQTEDDPLALRSLAHRERAWLCLKLGDFSAAQQHAEEALSLARASGDLLSEHLSVAVKAGTYGEAGDYAASVPLHSRALELARRLCLRRREAISLANLGEAFFGLRRFDEALDHFRRALEIFTEISDRACEGDCRVNVGRVMLEVGQHEEALDMLEQGRQICEERDRGEYEGIALLYIGRAHREAEELIAARGALDGAKALFDELGFHMLFRVERELALLSRAEGSRAEALAHASNAARLLALQRRRLPSDADTTAIAREAEAIRGLLDELS